MHLIYTGADHVDLGALADCTLDMAYGDGENDFELRVPVDSTPERLTFGSLIYVDGTEYGGIVDDVGSDTTGRIHKAVYSGRTWHGVLEAKVLRPNAGVNYLTVSGEAHAVLLQLVHRLGLADLFAVASTDSGIRIPSYQFARYIPGYTGLRSMLAAANAKLKMAWDGGRVVLWAEAVRDWTREEFDSERAGINIMLSKRPVNHLVCLGKGELAQRVVVDLYADEAGRVSRTQTLTGLDEVCEVYDYSSAEEAELVEQGTERLKSYQNASTCDVPMLPRDDYDIGDIVGGRDARLGLYVTAAICKKVVKIGRLGITTSCEAGAARALRVTQAL